MSRHHIALYGNVKIPSAFCEACHRTAFVLDGKLQCCDAPICNFNPTHFKRVSEPEFSRSQPSAMDKQAILNAQDHRCFYCERLFGEWVHKNKKPIRLRLNWDHLTPFSYQANNSTSNFVAACHLCNNWKRNFVFQTIEEARAYCASKWQNLNSRVPLVWSADGEDS